MERIAVYPGSFDPVTNGHLDIIRRGTRMFDRLIVAVGVQSNKTLHFSLPDRLRFLKTTLRPHAKVEVAPFSGLLVHFAKRRKATAVIRGLRAVSDFEYEFQMALMNRRQNSSFETVFLMPDEKYTYLSSSMVREVARLGGDIRGLVPPIVEKAFHTARHE